MNLVQLKILIKQGESENLEFKSSTGSLSSAMQTVCAFLNSKDGGIVIFGIKDDGHIIGQDVSDKTRKEIATELNKIEPHAKIDIFYISVEDDRQVIVMKIQADDKAPYTYDGRPFMRNQSTTMRMSKEEYMYLYNKNNQPLWESLTNNDCTLDDLDHERVKEVVRMAVFAKRLPESAITATVVDILTKLKLIMHDKITNAAVILFCKNENKQFMQSNVKLARFKGIDKTEFLDNKIIIGNAFDLYDKAMDFLYFNLPVAARIEPGNPIRVETPAIPYNVLREAITNAFVHRDYSYAGGSMSIARYNDRVAITNIGSLPVGVSLDKLGKTHESILRNPLIANVFYVCGKTEKWGRGTIDMIKDCKSVGNPLPIYEEIGNSFSVTLPLKESLYGSYQLESEQIIAMPQPKLTKRQQQIVDFLRTEPLTRQELMAKMNTKLADRTMQLELMTLTKMGIIDSEGKANATLWFLVRI